MVIDVFCLFEFKVGCPHSVHPLTRKETDTNQYICIYRKLICIYCTHHIPVTSWILATPTKRSMSAARARGRSPNEPGTLQQSAVVSIKRHRSADYLSHIADDFLDC